MNNSNPKPHPTLLNKRPLVTLPEEHAPTKISRKCLIAQDVADEHFIHIILKRDFSSQFFYGVD